MDDIGPPCVFCDIIDGSAPAELVWQDDLAVAFLDRRPLFHGHTLVVPAAHIVQLSDVPAEHVGPYFRRVQLIATAIPAALGVPGTFVAMNNVVSQSVAHLHTHVVPRRKGDGLRGFFWPRQQYGEGEATEVAGRLRRTLASFDAEEHLADR